MATPHGPSASATDAPDLAKQEILRLEGIGKRFPGVVRDLSTNGAFIAGEALPLMSRVAVRFDVEGAGAIDVIGWVLWRRDGDCEVPGASGDPLPLPRGIGILFEAIPLEARNAIARLVAK